MATAVVTGNHGACSGAELLSSLLAKMGDCPGMPKVEVKEPKRIFGC